MRATRIVVSAALMLIVTVANGASQSPAGPDGPAPVPPRLHSGEAVWVTTSGGDELAGTVRSASLLTLELTTTGVERSIEWKDIVLVEVRDSAWNGTRNGALIGAAAGGTFAGLLFWGLRCKSDCGPGYSATRDAIEGIAVGAAMGAGGGALAGWLIDSLVRGRDIRYRREPQDRHASIVPAVSRTRSAIYLTVCW